MDKKKLITTAFAAAALSYTGANADNHMEKCKIVNSNGVGVIKAHRGDCASSRPLHSCAGDAKMKSHKNDCATKGHSCAGDANMKAHKNDCATKGHSCAGDANMKAHKNDCATKGHSCAGNNEAGDPGAWVYLDTTICKATQKAVMEGKIDNIPDRVKKKIDLDMVK